MTAPPHAFRLANGLRLLVEPLPGRRLAAVAVTAGTGSRSDPPDASGLAHLVEHLMFPRGRGPADCGHVERIEGAGGLCNAITHRDYTSYHSIVPAEMLDTVLAWEARRLTAFAPTEPALRTELGAVAQEIREATAEAGALPWEAALAALFPGSRDGIGDIAQLRNVSPQQARAFFDAHYTTDNLVLSVVADAAPQAVAGSVADLFGALPAGPPRPAAGTAARTSVARTVRPTPPADHSQPDGPVTIRATPMPDPRTELHHYAAQVLLTHLLNSSRMPYLVRRTPAVLSAELHCGHHGQWLNSTSPDLLLAVVLLRPNAPASATNAWQQPLRELADCPPSPEELRRTRNTLLLHHFRHTDSPLGRAIAHGRFATLFPDRPGLTGLPALFAGLTPDDMAVAARRLLAQEWIVLPPPGNTA
ncbi:M16 family metallopeptidase [Streptomyces sp. NPDC020883]|uniref:M16 family metallopeptidase n=1 Tax=Streptomyces sp. NPDC020883 TaxID=3365099 RepID=UPI00379C888B